ncbi:MAG: hypothetical protein K8L99_31435 [Anaerolineae bacterium]|nr:hypothetical protein [Anaerolineae bacterium]
MDSKQQEIVNHIADEIERLTARMRLYLPELLLEVQRELHRREETRKATERAARIEQARISLHLLSWDDLSTKYSFHTSEEWAAAIYLPTQTIEQGVTYFVDREPTAAERRAIAGNTAMNVQQVCDYLGVDHDQFGKLKKQYKLEHVSITRTEQDDAGLTTIAYLYRKSEIDRLKAHISSKNTHPLPGTDEQNT